MSDPISLFTRWRTTSASQWGELEIQKDASMVRKGRQSFRGIICSSTRSVAAVVIAWQLMSGLASAIDIEDMRWGFNGKVALNRFNILSVLVRNPTPQPFDGEMRLVKKLGGAATVDARIVEPVSLAPFSSKWVQFYPYVNGAWGNSVGNETWWLQYGRGETVEVPQPRVAKYQRVILDDSSGLGPRGGVLRRMPENLFPSFISATDGLQVVALDREPRTWIPTQKECFLEWIDLGGTVVLLHGSSGKFPDFSGPLAVLNSPLDDRRYGAGRVMKVGMQRAQFNEDEARQAFVSLPKNHLQPNEKPEDPIDYVDPTEQNQANPNAYGEGADPFSASSFMGQLKEMTKPEHNWILLHFMFWVYIAMVFPGCYLLGKRWSDFRVVYAGLLGTVVLFSFLFSIVGQRGYGEATAVHSVAIAKALPDGGLDVAAWSNVFVTNGAYYTIKHNGRGALYSTCNESEQVNGEINNGADGSFRVDIPPFSNREFATRIKLPAGSPKIKVDSFKLTEARLAELELSIDGVKQEDTQFVNALFGDRFYTLHWQNGKLKLAGDAGDAASMLKVQNMQNWSRNQYGYGYDYQREGQTVKDRFNLMYTPLLSRSLNVARESEARQVRLPPDLVRVFLYAKMPAEFAVQSTSLGGHNGEVLYCVDVPLPVQ
ncbi:MAG: hypothetical protein JWP89_3294 [Schlesneria sp.]|nr:hypothetical protein [Schlesneria sp.]